MKVDVTVSCGDLKKDGKCKSYDSECTENRSCCLFCHPAERRACYSECNKVEGFRCHFYFNDFQPLPETIRPIKEK